MVEKKGGIPTEQWAVQVYGEGKWEIEKIPVPRPGPGEVLVKIECAPVNPSDTYFIRGMYKSLGADSENEEKMAAFKYPTAPGWEGSGTVIESGGGFMGWRLNGKRVGVTKS
jgi:NADPH:quinone reductase-like Zn-dependent oxidoreductase